MIYSLIFIINGFLGKEYDLFQWELTKMQPSMTFQMLPVILMYFLKKHNLTFYLLDFTALQCCCSGKLRLNAYVGNSFQSSLQCSPKVV